MRYAAGPAPPIRLLGACCTPFEDCGSPAAGTSAARRRLRAKGLPGSRPKEPLVRDGSLDKRLQVDRESSGGYPALAEQRVWGR